MAIIRKSELKAMSTEQMQEKLREIELSLQEETANIKSGKRQKVLKYKPLRKVRARIKTYLKQRGVIV